MNNRHYSILSKINTGWQLYKMSELANIKAGGTPSTFVEQFWVDGRIPWMNSGDLNKRFVFDVNGRITEQGQKNSSTFLVPKHSVLVGLAGQGKTRGTVAINEIDLCINQSIAAIMPKSSDVYYLFLFYNLDSRYGELRKISAGDGGRGGLNLSIIGNIDVLLPTFGEQKEIATILSTWDRAIERVQRLIEAKQRQKKGLMQGLLTGRLRFPEFGESINTSDAFPTDWEVKKLKQVFSQIDRPLGSRIPESVLSISAKIGFVDQKTKFGKVVAGKSLEKYILLQRGEFAYNRGNSNAYPQGCIYMLTEYDEGAIPNVYYAFRVKSGNIFPQFYQYYFESGLLNPQLKMFISSSARGDGLFNISSKDFFGIKIVVPPFEEQKKIASVLGGMDEQIALLKKYLVKLKKQKNGLMQKLLTGEIRVKVD